MIKMEIQADEKYVISQLQNGVELNPYYSADLDAKVLNMKKRGWESWNGDGLIHVEIKDITLDEFKTVMSLDKGDVINFTPYLVITDMGLQVPDYLPNAYKTTNIGTEDNSVIETTIKTWEEWVKPNYPPTVIGEETWILSYSGTDKAEALSGEVLFKLETEEPNVSLEINKPVIEE